MGPESELRGVRHRCESLPMRVPATVRLRRRTARAPPVVSHSLRFRSTRLHSPSPPRVTSSATVESGTAFSRRRLPRGCGSQSLPFLRRGGGCDRCGIPAAWDRHRHGLAGKPGWPHVTPRLRRCHRPGRRAYRTRPHGSRLRDCRRSRRTALPSRTDCSRKRTRRVTSRCSRGLALRERPRC